MCYNEGMRNSRYKEILLNYLKLCLNNKKNYLGIFCAVNRDEFRNIVNVSVPLCKYCYMKEDCRLEWGNRNLCLR